MTCKVEYRIVCELFDLKKKKWINLTKYPVMHEIPYNLVFFFSPCRLGSENSDESYELSLSQVFCQGENIFVQLETSCPLPRKKSKRKRTRTFLRKMYVKISSFILFNFRRIFYFLFNQIWEHEINLNPYFWWVNFEKITTREIFFFLNVYFALHLFVGTDQIKP